MTTEIKRSIMASIISPPSGELLPKFERIQNAARERGLGYIAWGFVSGLQEKVSANEDGVAYITMNKSGRMDVEPGEDGVISTSALAGCTGIAGFARRNDGTIATFISHYDTLSQNSKFTGQDTPANKDLYAFKYQAKDEDLDGDRYYVIAYENGEHNNPDYGRKKGIFKDWSYLDQLNVTAAQLGEKSKIMLLPYNAWDSGHSLASGKSEGVEGIFWDGKKIDIDELLKTLPIDGSSTEAFE